MKGTLGITVCVAALMAANAATAQELVIWHDKGDDGLAMIEEMSALFEAQHPGVTVTSLSYPTEQWFNRSIAGLNTNTGPDILFNDNNRIATIQQSTGRLCSVADLVDALPDGDRAYITDGDIASATLEGDIIMMPFQRVVIGWGARQSWLDAVGEEYPETWDDMIRIAQLFQDTDPDGNGEDDTFGVALQAGSAPSMIGAGTRMFAIAGNGVPYDIMNTDAEIVITDPTVADPTIGILQLFTEHGLVSPDTVNHNFTDMYQLIEGGRVGFFRVGNWNVAKWDREALEGDYVVGPYPSHIEGQPGHMLVNTVRGMAVPCDGDNVDLARDFVSFIVSQEAQQASLDHMGGVVRDDLDISGVTPGLTPFVSGEYPMATDSFMASIHPWYPELEEAYYRHLIDAVSNPPQDWDAWLQATAEDLQNTVAELQN